jgi:rod shape-determining protein MreD
MNMSGSIQDKDERGPFLRALAAFGRGGLVVCVLACFFMLNLVPFSLAQVAGLRPPFLLMAVFYLTIFRPGLLRVPVVFMMGVLMDSALGWPLGVSALLLVLVQWVTLSQRRFFMGQSFLTVWWGYVLVSALAAAAQWVLFSLFSLSMMPLAPVGGATALGALFFPFAVVPLYLMHRVLSRAPGLIDS